MLLIKDMKLDISLIKKVVSIDTYNVIAHNTAKVIAKNFKYDVMLYTGKKGVKYVILKGYIYTGNRRTRLSVVKSIGNIKTVKNKYNTENVKDILPFFTEEMEVKAYKKVIETFNK